MRANESECDVECFMARGLGDSIALAEANLKHTREFGVAIRHVRRLAVGERVDDIACK